MMRKLPTIEQCFFRTEEGKCVSLEIYRFNPHVEKTGNCAHHPKSAAFLNGKLLCLEFRTKTDSEERKETTQ